MERWHIAYCCLNEVEEYLKGGWEPFAVTLRVNTEQGFEALIWLRRKD